MKKLLFILLLFAFAISTDAQTADKRWNIGFHGGATQYNGELGNGFYNTKTAFYGFGGLSVSRYLGNRLDVSLLLTKGEVGYTSDLGHFRNQMTTGTINFRFNFFNADAFIRPYIFAGMGAMMFVNDSLPKEERYDAALPSFGGGLNVRLGKAVMLNLQETFMLSNSDTRDGIVEGSPDGFLFHSIGLTFNFGKKKDADKDGVADRHDKCPDTPIGTKVDAKGCMLDKDNDGVADNEDKCPDVAGEVSLQGCPDKDGDGITDLDDNCPAVAGLKLLQGCPDSDSDGVADYLDKCLNTSAGAKVDENGCPIDTDNDGVSDNIDKCPNTPAQAQVDEFGCSLDADKDGVSDNLDKCPNTPDKGIVDEFGCLLDTDRDGVADYLDKCPVTAGTLENQSCPEVKKEVKMLFQKALQGIKFETGKSIIKPVSYPILDAVVKVMNENPTYKLIIGGHTDNVGSETLNITLSQNRADAVAVYLIEKGVSPTRVAATGYSFNKPVDDNSTVAGRARNRRVELSVEFIEKVEN